MTKKLDNFLEEFTNNFSELYVETFLIRYLNDFNEKDLVNTIESLNTKLNVKINQLFRSKLEDMGYYDFEQDKDN